MNELIDLILSNPLFLIILIGGVVSLLKGKTEQAEERDTTNKTKPRSIEDLFERAHQREQTRSTEKVEKVSKEPINTKTIEQLREEQMSRFAGQADDDEDQQKNDEYTSRSSNRIMEENTKVNH